MKKYVNKSRQRGTFTLTGLEHRGARDQHERMVCYVESDSGLLVLWGTADSSMDHIHALEQRVATSKYPVTIECDWIEPDEYEATRFRHRYWVHEDDYFRIVQ